METECSKRVYQGVRVKHTVKDLLAEKRSRQTSGPRYTGVSSPSSSFVQMTGSHVLPSYYGMRRPFLSDTEFCSSAKPFSADVYSSSLTGKSLPCDALSGYSSLIDNYYPESFGDYRSASLSSAGSTIFSQTALSSLLPPYSTEPYFLRDSWEPGGSEVVEGLCGDALAHIPLPTATQLVDHEGDNLSQFRSSSRGSTMASSQSYTLHTLDDVAYHSSFQSTSPTFISSFQMDPACKLAPALPQDDTEHNTSALNDSLVWNKEESGSTWAQFEVRRAF
ncbi:hypothetical protein DNTS_000608 [Danionella cerebrum]|uniref:OCA domain-containing protein n=1 Tax=Danionella cerebrum TaxID=2873325 RepID=A0A553R7U5_9TELE|nr:hypothetical protein DNTS_000608 [Danionella translucida]